MKKSTLQLVAIALLLSAAARARADQISWSYSFSASSSTIQSNGAADDAGYISVSAVQGTLTGTLPMATSITAANLEAFSTASAKTPATFNNVEYTLTMKLTDLSSGLQAAVTFEGVLNGTVSASGSSLTNKFVGQTSFSYNLNHHIYDISIGNFQQPGAPGSAGATGLGSIDINVTVHHNPEPSSLLLGALGLPALGLFRKRRRPANA
jgi:hypothetical protein